MRACVCNKDAVIMFGRVMIGLKVAFDLSLLALSGLQLDRVLDYILAVAPLYRTIKNEDRM